MGSVQPSRERRSVERGEGVHDLTDVADVARQRDVLNVRSAPHRANIGGTTERACGSGGSPEDPAFSEVIRHHRECLYSNHRQISND